MRYQLTLLATVILLLGCSSATQTYGPSLRHIRTSFPAHLTRHLDNAGSFGEGPATLSDAISRYGQPSSRKFLALGLSKGTREAVFWKYTLMNCSDCTLGAIGLTIDEKENVLFTAYHIPSLKPYRLKTGSPIYPKKYFWDPTLAYRDNFPVFQYILSYDTEIDPKHIDDIVKEAMNVWDEFKPKGDNSKHISTAMIDVSSIQKNHETTLLNDILNNLTTSPPFSPGRSGQTWTSITSPYPDIPSIEFNRTPGGDLGIRTFEGSRRIASYRTQGGDLGIRTFEGFPFRLQLRMERRADGSWEHKPIQSDMQGITGKILKK